MATLLDPGLEIPIEFDRVCGRATGISTPPAGLPSTDPLLAPIEGVTWQQFIAVRADIANRPSVDGFDEMAQQYGVR
ncbi:MAG: hypothetical protein H0T40_05390, partial [Geodermatophilaceae bacterium]|nr:hypothetical protein [Geodermatophilaceae bacterium]